MSWIILCVVLWFSLVLMLLMLLLLFCNELHAVLGDVQVRVR